MTALKCLRCGGWWSMNTRHPELQFSVINRFCPNCIPAVAPLMGVVPFPKRSA